MRARGSPLSPRFRRKRLWPWAVLLLPLLGLAAWELSSRSSSRSLGAGSRKEPAADSPSLPGAGHLSGFVLGPGGEAAPGVFVSVGPAGPEATTDSRGAFQLDVGDRQTVRLDAHHSDLGVASIEVIAPARGIELRLVPRAGLDVQVASRGRPVGGAEVTVVEAEHRSSERLYQADRPTDLTGKVRILGLPPGHLIVGAVDPTTGARGSVEVVAHEGEILPAIVSLPAVTP
jgi:hypothetical protein